MRSVSVLGLRVDELDYSRTVEQVRRWAEAGESRTLCPCTVHTVMEAHDDPLFRAVMNGTDLVCADGMPVVWTCRWLGLAQQRVFGPELTERLCAMAAAHGIAVGFYGSTPAVIDDLRRRLPARHPGLTIAYAWAPPFRDISDNEMDTVVQAINCSGTRIVFVGLGCRRQERWMDRARPRLRAVMLGVGWAFDVCSGHSRTAPGWMQQAGLEWLFRLLRHPGKVWKRQLKHNPRFVVLVLRHLLGRWLTGAARR